MYEKPCRLSLSARAYGGPSGSTSGIGLTGSPEISSLPAFGGANQPYLQNQQAQYYQDQLAQQSAIGGGDQSMGYSSLPGYSPWGGSGVDPSSYSSLFGG
jgi:hypothetical protein